MLFGHHYKCALFKGVGGDFEHSPGIELVTATTGVEFVLE